MIHCDGHIFISFVFQQFTSLHSVLHFFHGLMNSINWPASSVWVFIAQLREHCSANAEATGSNPVEAPKIFFSGYFRNHCNGHIFISFVFPQFTSLHSVLHSFHGLMNSINWPAFSVWVFIAQLREHCSVNAEATGSNPVEAPKIFFAGYFRNCLNCDSLPWSHTHFISIPAVYIITFSASFPSRVDELNKLTSLQCMGLHSSAGRALQR